MSMHEVQTEGNQTHATCIRTIICRCEVLVYQGIEEHLCVPYLADFPLGSYM